MSRTEHYVKYHAQTLSSKTKHIEELQELVGLSVMGCSGGLSIHSIVDPTKRIAPPHTEQTCLYFGCNIADNDDGSRSLASHAHFEGEKTPQIKILPATYF